MKNNQGFIHDRHEQSLLRNKEKIFLMTLLYALQSFFSYKHYVLSLSFSDLNERAHVSEME